MSFHERLHFAQQACRDRVQQRRRNRMEYYALSITMNGSYGKLGSFAKNRPPEEMQKEVDVIKEILQKRIVLKPYI